MIIKNIIQLGNPLLRQRAKKVDPKSQTAKRAIKDMLDTMRASKLVGIAAPQIGRSYRIIMAEIRPHDSVSRQDYPAEELQIFINPKVLSYSKKKKMVYEGCGSVAYGKIFGPVTRPDKITIEAFDQKGQKFTSVASGLLSTIIQHEYDHLEGIVFTDKLDDVTKLLSLEEYKKLRKAKKIP